MLWLERIPDDYRKPVVYAALLHLILFLAFFISVEHAPVLYSAPSSNSAPIIQASMVNTPAAQPVMAPKPPQPVQPVQATPTPPDQAQEEQQAAAKAEAAKQALEKAQKVQAEKAAQLKAAAQAKALAAKKKAIEKKQQAEKKRQAELAAKAKAAREAAKKEELRKLAAANIQRILNQDKDAPQTNTLSAAQVASIKEQYMGMIQQIVRANWINQFNPLDHLEVILAIQLDADGTVESVSVQTSSGNPAFDRQAMLAVEKSSPLPMPKEADVAADFEHLILPFDNQKV